MHEAMLVDLDEAQGEAADLGNDTEEGLLEAQIDILLEREYDEIDPP